MAETESTRRLPDWSWLRLARFECGAVHIARESGAYGLADYHWTICQYDFFYQGDVEKIYRLLIC